MTLGNFPLLVGVASKEEPDAELPRDVEDIWSRLPCVCADNGDSGGPMAVDPPSDVVSVVPADPEAVVDVGVDVVSAVAP